MFIEHGVRQLDSSATSDNLTGPTDAHRIPIEGQKLPYKKTASQCRKFQDGLVQSSEYQAFVLHPL